MEHLENLRDMIRFSWENGGHEPDLMHRAVIIGKNQNIPISIFILEELIALGAPLNTLSQGLSTSNPAAAPVQPTAPSGSTANSYPPQFCPPGYYAAGIQAWGSPGSTRCCIGCLTGAALLCKPFPAAQ